MKPRGEPLPPLKRQSVCINVYVLNTCTKCNTENWDAKLLVENCQSCEIHSEILLSCISAVRI